MGHQQADRLPRTPPFKRVISLLGDSAGGGGIAGVGPGSLEDVALATLIASDDGLERAKDDEGLSYCVFLMTQLTRAATATDFAAALAELGMPGPPTATFTPDYAIQPSLSSSYSVFDLVAGFVANVDRHLTETGVRSDISEMAQLSASESLTALCGDNPVSLFESSANAVQIALKRLSTERGFARLTHDFFGRFLRRYLEYHLSRELSNHVGGRRRFANVGEHNLFLDQLEEHCRIKTIVIRQFAGEWYGKHNFQNDFTPRQTMYFVGHAIDKIRDAIKRGEGGDVG